MFQIRFDLRNFEHIDMVGISFINVEYVSGTYAACHLICVVRDGAVDIHSSIFFDLLEILSNSHDVRFDYHNGDIVRRITHSA